VVTSDAGGAKTGMITSHAKEHSQPLMPTLAFRLFLANSEFAVIPIHRVQDGLSQSFDFTIFKRGNQIQAGLLKGELC
jgi:hypothetical protein